MRTARARAGGRGCGLGGLAVERLEGRRLFAAGDLRAQLSGQVTTAVGDSTTAAIAAENYHKAHSDVNPIEPNVGSGGYTA